MSAAHPVTVPLINPNEPDAVLVRLDVSNGAWVNEGEPLCALETTKSTWEMAAERAGYVTGLDARPGDHLQAGQLLCYLAESPGWRPPQSDQQLPVEAASGAPPGVRITQPALALAEQSGLDLSALPKGPLVTSATIQEILAGAGAAALREHPEGEYNDGSIVVYGGGGHGKSVIELIRAVGGLEIAGIVDDRLAAGAEILGAPILGGAEALGDISRKGVRLAANAVGGIGDVRVRIAVFQRLSQAGFGCPALVHPTAFVEPSAHLSPGVQVFPHAYVGSDVQLGAGVIVNTGAIVSHDCQIGDYANLSPGAILAGGVRIGRGALVGMGATINLVVQVGAGARIGNGATVKRDVPENGLVRAGAIWPD